MDSTTSHILGRLPEMRQRGRPTGAIEAMAFPMPLVVLMGLRHEPPGQVGVALLVCGFEVSP